MNQTLNEIFNDYRSRLRISQNQNIQVFERKFSNETIEFPPGPMVNFVWSSFRNSDLINIKFINVNLELSYFKKCLFENCSFKNTNLQEAEFDCCIFKNCRFSHCNFSEVWCKESIFNECTFSESCFNTTVFELCHFMIPIFEDVKGIFLSAAVLIDLKFSNSKKSIEFQGEMYFMDIFDQIDKFYIDKI